MISSLDFAHIRLLVLVITVPMQMIVAIIWVIVNVIVVFGDDIIVGVSVVRDEGAALLVTSELDLIFVNLMEWSCHRVITDLNHGTVRRHSSSG